MGCALSGTSTHDAGEAKSAAHQRALAVREAIARYRMPLERRAWLDKQHDMLNTALTNAPLTGQQLRWLSLALGLEHGQFIRDTLGITDPEVAIRVEQLGMDEALPVGVALPLRERALERLAREPLMPLRRPRLEATQQSAVARSFTLEDLARVERYLAQLLQRKVSDEPERQSLAAAREMLDELLPTSMEDLRAALRGGQALPVQVHGAWASLEGLFTQLALTSGPYAPARTLEAYRTLVHRRRNALEWLRKVMREPPRGSADEELPPEAPLPLLTGHAEAPLLTQWGPWWLWDHILVGEEGAEVLRASRPGERVKEARKLLALLRKEAWFREDVGAAFRLDEAWRSWNGGRRPVPGWLAEHEAVRDHLIAFRKAQVFIDHDTDPPEHVRERLIVLEAIEAAAAEGIASLAERVRRVRSWMQRAKAASVKQVRSFGEPPPEVPLQHLSASLVSWMASRWQAQVDGAWARRFAYVVGELRKVGPLFEFVQDVEEVAHMTYFELAERFVDAHPGLDGSIEQTGLSGKPPNPDWLRSDSPF